MTLKKLMELEYIQMQFHSDHYQTLESSTKASSAFWHLSRLTYGFRVVMGRVYHPSFHVLMSFLFHQPQTSQAEDLYYEAFSDVSWQIHSTIPMDLANAKLYIDTLHWFKSIIDIHLQFSYGYPCHFLSLEQM